MATTAKPKSKLDQAADKINEAAEILRDTVASNKAEISQGATLAVADAKK